MAEEKNKVAGAFELATKNCGGKPKMLAALDMSESWMYTCRNKESVPLKTALKLQVLTKGRFKWQDLCPGEVGEINDVKQYMIS